MKRFWISWHQPTEDERPLTYPPGPSILGWWCSGYDQDGIPTLCALVEAESESNAKADIKLDWPEAERWRFVNEVATDWLPGDRFPLPDWSAARIREAADA